MLVILKGEHVYYSLTSAAPGCLRRWLCSSLESTDVIIQIIFVIIEIIRVASMSLQAAQEVYEWVCKNGTLLDNLGTTIFFSNTYCRKLF